jgi:excisionase family DNA binding protein
MNNGLKLVDTRRTRTTQFGVRENTTSSRQHAPRRAMNASALQPDPLFGTDQQVKGTQELQPPIKETFKLSLTVPDKRATGGGKERIDNPARLSQEKLIPFFPIVQDEGFEPLLDSREAAALLRIHPKTLQRLAREGDIAGIQIGKLWRFRASSLNHWLEKITT